MGEGAAASLLTLLCGGDGISAMSEDKSGQAVFDDAIDRMSRRPTRGSLLPNEPETPRIVNAIISGAKFDTERGLSAWVYLDYGGSGQGFGGYLLYAPEGWKNHGSGGNFCGHFIWRVLEIAEVDDWAKLKGRSVRVETTHEKIIAIGHIIHDKWFRIAEEFKVIEDRANVPRDAEETAARRLEILRLDVQELWEARARNDGPAAIEAERGLFVRTSTWRDERAARVNDDES